MLTYAICTDQAAARGATQVGTRCLIPLDLLIVIAFSSIGKQYFLEKSYHTEDAYAVREVTCPTRQT